jgi:transposase-like protein
MVARSEWEVAEFTDEYGRLGRSVPSGHVLVPGSIELDGPLLVWKYAPDVNTGPKTYVPSGDVLNRFVELWKGTLVDETIRPVRGPADTPTQLKKKFEEYKKDVEARLPAANDRTLRFARKYGILGFDKDVNLAFDWDVEGVELLDTWWEISRQVYAFLNIAAALNKSRVGDPRDWSAIDSFIDDPKFPQPPNAAVVRYLPHGVAAARSYFELRLQDWLHSARITFGLTANAGHGFTWRTEIDYKGRLYSALVLQLLLTVTNTDSLYFCSGCSLPYMRPKKHKKPNAGEANFCSSCGREEALRQADRRRRKKVATARRLDANGFSVRQISQRLETTPESVRRWLKKAK